MSIRLIVVGGFLGAGKTTLLLRVAQQLTAQGYRVGLVTNDQGSELVDTALAAAQAVPVVEVAGGCFCCRFPDLSAALQQLQKTVQPDVILAEPVGSCTDLLATVVRPLLALYPEQYEVAPLTVLVDASRHSVDYGATVNYLYQKQLAEAEVLAISKVDRLEPAAAAGLVEQLDQIYAPTPLLALSAQTGEGIAAWLELVLSQRSQAVKPLELDYQQYAAAEAQLAWLNLQGELHSQQAFAAQNWIHHLLRTLDQALLNRQAAIAHVKLQATAAAASWKASLTQSGAAITWDLAPAVPAVQQLRFILNARVHTTPAILEQTVRWAFAELTPAPDFHYSFAHLACFAPAAPQPTHRLLA